MDGNESDGSDSGSEELPTQNRDDHGEADDPDEDGSEASPVHMQATLRQVYYDSEAESVDVEAIEVEEPYDISIAASHSYLGAGLEQARGRRVLEAGWRGRVPVAAHHGVVFPGEVVPMLLPHAADAALIVDAINTHKLFGLLCPSETGDKLSGYGVLCEVMMFGIEHMLAQPTSVTFKARAIHRFVLERGPRAALAYRRMRAAELRVLPELAARDGLRAARLASLDALRSPLPL